MVCTGSIALQTTLPVAAAAAIAAATAFAAAATAAATVAAAAAAEHDVKVHSSQELVSWWEAAHYTVLQRRCAEAGMPDLAAKQATSLLRYIGAIPADKAFYEAGNSMPSFCALVFVHGTVHATPHASVQPPSSFVLICMSVCMPVHLYVSLTVH